MRRFSIASDYLKRNEVITPSTSMNSMCSFLSTLSGNSASRNSQNESSGLKTQVKPLESFFVNTIEFKEWEIGEVATLGQTAHGEILYNLPTVENSTEEARNKELFNMLVANFMKGSELHILNSV